MTDASTLRSVLSDAELILATRAGDGDAYGELYVRHLQSARAAARALTRSKADADDIVAEAFSRVLGVLQRGGGPDISFRPYLLTTIRNSFYERSRKVRLDDPTDEPDDTVNLALLDMSASEDDRALVASAFASLPERWQLVLWHTEVEGRSAAEVAPLLGIAANAVAALAYRAREGLREAYLQSHLLQPMADACQSCVSNLGAYVRDSLPARDRRRVDEHLETCASCPPLLAEISDANTRLRAVLIPLIVGVSAAKYLAGLHAGNGVVGSFRRMPRSQQTMVGTVAASLVAALVLVGVVVAGNDDTQRIVAADSAIIDDSIAAAVSTVSDSALASATTPDERSDQSNESDDSTGASDDSTGASDPFDTVETTPSNTLPTTQDSVDIFTLPPGDVDQPVIPQYVPPTSPRTTPRTTPTTQPRTTPATARPVTSTEPTQPTVAPTFPTVQPTIPDTQPTTPPTPAPTTTAAPTTSSSTTTTLAPVIPPAPQVVASVTRPAFANGKAVIEIIASNGRPAIGRSGPRSIRRAGDASNVKVTLPLPVGITFDSVEGNGWTCAVAAGTTDLVCSVPNIADQQQTSADVKLSIADTAANPFSLRPSIAAGSADPVAAQPLSVPVSTIANSIMSDYDTGSITIIGNSNMTCNDVSPTRECVAARAGTASSSAKNNRQSQQMIFVGGGSELINSSKATLTLGASTISQAFLIWGGDTAVSGGTTPDIANKHKVRLSDGTGAPAEIVSTNVSTWADGSLYSAYADVTDMLRSLVSASPSTIQVADIQASQGDQSLAGWSLVVVTHNPADPMRLLTVTTPGALINSAPYSSAIPLETSNDARAVSVVVASFEGELGLTSDQFTIGSGSPFLNAFDSSVRGAADQINVNNFGVGSSLFPGTVTGNSLALSSEVIGGFADQVRLAIVAAAIDLAPSG